MTTLTTKFGSLEDQLVSQNTAILAAMNELQSTLELLNSNGATNTRYLLNALARLDPCQDCGTVPVISLPVPGTVPPAVNTVHCARVQVLLALIRKALVKIDIISTLGLGFNVSIINAAINEVIADALYPSGMPGPSFVEISTLIGSGLAYVASNIIRGDSLVALFDTQYSALLAALYAAGDAASGLSAYQSVIGSAGLPADEVGELDAVAFVSWFNWIFDQSNMVDVTGYDGGICGGSGCYDVSSTAYTNSPGGFNANGICGDIGGFSAIATVATTDVDQSFTPSLFHDGNLAGWTMTIPTGSCIVAYRAGDTSSHTLFSSTGVLGGASGVIDLPACGCWAIYHSEPFSIVLCPPGS